MEEPRRRSAAANTSSDISVLTETMNVEIEEASPRHETTVVTAHPVTVSASVSNVGVPVSLPVGSIIGVANSVDGATFNVITSDQMQLSASGQFKQMLCVDNGFLCQSEDKHNDPLHWNRELKTTHIVIQNSNAEENDSDSLQVSSDSRDELNTWRESASMPVLPVRCKNTNAELHKSRFGSGGRGRCIKLGSNWYTPSEFEALCGRASSKDWKRSIRFGGRSIQALIDEQILRPHATSCTCSACCDDDNATGPVRLFIPYKRKKRTKEQTDSDSGVQRKHKVENSRDESCNDESDCEAAPVKEAWPQFVTTDGVIVQSTQEEIDPMLEAVHHQNESCHSVSKFQKLDEVCSSLLKVAQEFKRIVENLKTEEKQQVRDQNLANQLSSSNVIETVGLQPTSDTHHKKCANCNREAFAECSLCRRTPYCSTFCQRKDWGTHQVECVRDATETVMLIVEGSAADVDALSGGAAD